MSSRSRGPFWKRGGGSKQPRQGPLSAGQSLGKRSRTTAATSTTSSRYRRMIGAAALRNQRRVLLACAPVATSVHARGIILASSPVEVVGHLARLHALEIGLHIRIE